MKVYMIQDSELVQKTDFGVCSTIFPITGKFRLHNDLWLNGTRIVVMFDLNHYRTIDVLFSKQMLSVEYPTQIHIGSFYTPQGYTSPSNTIDAMEAIKSIQPESVL